MTMAKKANKKADVSFIKQSTVKEFLAGQGFRSSSDIFEALNDQIADILVQGAERCKANNRQTVKGSDI
jgi:histone H3/H4